MFQDSKMKMNIEVPDACYTTLIQGIGEKNDHHLVCHSILPKNGTIWLNHVFMSTDLKTMFNQLVGSTGSRNPMLANEILEFALKKVSETFKRGIKERLRNENPSPSRN